MADLERTDAEIIEASLTDPGQFEEIFRRHHAAVYRHALRRVGVTDAGDVAADVFVRALAIRHRYDLSRQNCLPWLYGITANIVGDRMRKTRRRRMDTVLPDPDGDVTEDADSRVMAAALSEPVNGVLDQLSEDDRTTFLLFALEGLTYGEIADLLGVPPGTVGSRISRVREKVLALLPDLEQRLKRDL